jgi:hypothetical protein
MSITPRGHEISSAIELPVLWNPKAVAAWSLLFTPVFGALLQMMNWKALGKREESREAMRWTIASAILILPIYFVAAVAPELISVSVAWVMNITYYGLLFVWYAVSGRDQVQHVADVLSNQYRRRHWGFPLMWGVFSFAVIFAIAIWDVFVETYAPGV